METAFKKLPKFSTANYPDGHFVRTKYGIIRIWNDESGIYADLINGTLGDVCLVSMHPHDEGIETLLYGNHHSGVPTYQHIFDELDDAFSFDEELF